MIVVNNGILIFCITFSIWNGKVNKHFFNFEDWRRNINIVEYDVLAILAEILLICCEFFMRETVEVANQFNFVSLNLLKHFLLDLLLLFIW